MLNTAGEEATSSLARGKVRPGQHRRGSSFSYQLLPSQTLISLSILKLDNSSFGDCINILFVILLLFFFFSFGLVFFL
jgi:hypothetical protein